MLLTSRVGESRDSVRTHCGLLGDHVLQSQQGSFWLVSKPALKNGPGMFRRDELRRAGTCGVSWAVGKKFIMQCGFAPSGQISGEGVQQEGSKTSKLCSVACSGRFRIPCLTLT